jgi:hypothetical protein
MVFNSAFKMLMVFWELKHDEVSSCLRPIPVLLWKVLLNCQYFVSAFHSLRVILSSPINFPGIWNSFISISDFYLFMVSPSTLKFIKTWTVLSPHTSVFFFKTCIVILKCNLK